MARLQNSLFQNSLFQHSLFPHSRLRPSLLARVLIAAWAMSSALTARLDAQTGEATILGVVSDSGARPIEGATVSIRNAATGATWRQRTNTRGRFALVQLPLGGPYDITVQHVGLRTERRTGYTLTLGQRVAVQIVLKPAPTVLDQVAVRARTDETRGSTIGGNRRIDGRDIAAIPASGRNFTDLAALAPTTGAQLSMLGQRWTSTDVRIDGVQARNMLRAGEFGAGPFTLSLEAIREFDVSTAVYDVVEGRQGGGSLRAATRAGTNEWRGSVFSYYRGSNLSASQDFQSRTRAQRQFDAVQWGASVGGPIILDRAQLFIAFDRQDSNEPIFSGLLQTPADERASGVARDSLARLVRILGQDYGLDTTRAQVGRLDRRPVANTLFARLDWAFGSVHRFTLTHNLNAWDSPLSGGVDLPVALFESRSNYRSLEHQSVATWRSSLTSGLQNALSLGVSVSKRTLTPNSGVPRGFVRIQSQLADGSAGDTRIQFGGNRLAPDDSRETEYQLLDRFSTQRGRVLYAFGVDNTLTSLQTYIAESQGGLFEFQSLRDLEQRRAFRYSRTVPLVDPRPSTRQRVLELGAFAQAEWQLSPSIAVTAGLRWDGTAFLSTPPRNALVEQVLGERTDRAPSDWTKLQPRLQAIWDVGNRGRDFVRVGGGRFAAQPIYYLQHNQLLNDGSRIADITLSGAAVPVPDFSRYRADASSSPGLPAGAGTPTPYVNLVDPSFRTPSVWKASASYQRRVGRRLVLTGTALGSRTRDNYMYLDRNLRAAPSFTLFNEGNRAVFVPANSIDAAGRTLNANALANPQLGRVLELTSIGRASEHAAIAEATVTLPRDARLEFSYTFNRASDNSSYGCCLARTATTFTAITSDPRNLATSWGPADLDFRHKLVLAGTLPTWLGVRVGGRYVGSNGRPFSAIVNGDINGDEATSNDLAFVFDPDSPSTPKAVADAMRRVLANPRNVARAYLREHLGHVASRNGAFAPWTGRIDLRAERDVRTMAGQSIAIALDVFNVANLLNRRWGAEYQLPVGISSQNPVVQRIALLNVVGFDQATRQYVYTVNENFGVLQKSGNAYQMQLSARYRF